MRILIAASPSPGNLIPTLTFARAASEAGHEVALLTAGDMQPIASPVPVLAAGPSWSELGAANAARHAGGMGETGVGADLTPAQVAEFFASTRLELGHEEVEAAADAFDPDLVVAEVADAYGPYVAALRGKPWFAHGFGVALPAAFSDALTESARPFYGVRGLEPTAPAGYLDPWPEILQPPTRSSRPDRIPIRLETFRSASAPWQSRRVRPGHVVVSLGTQVSNPDALATAVRSILNTLDVDVVVTLGPVEPLPIEDDRLTQVEFVGLADLVRGASLVVSAGGSGTVLGALSSSLPVVVLPFLPSQRWVAERLLGQGAGDVVTDPRDVGSAVARVHGSDRHRLAAAAAAASIASLPPAHVAARRVVDLATRLSR